MIVGVFLERERVAQIWEVMGKAADLASSLKTTNLKNLAYQAS